MLQKQPARRTPYFCWRRCFHWIEYNSAVKAVPLPAVLVNTDALDDTRCPPPRSGARENLGFADGVMGLVP